MAKKPSSPPKSQAPKPTPKSTPTQFAGKAKPMSGKKGGKC